MLSNTPKPPFTQAIALYGDRAGSKGTFKFAGFAWIQSTKVVLAQGDAQTLSSTAEWRCLLRLVTLAHRLKKPLILWDLPIAHIAAIQRQTSLAFAQAIQETELELLKLPHPIIAVFDETHHIDDNTSELIWNDGMVIPVLWEPQFSERKNVRIAQCSTDVAAAILELLHQAEASPATELIENRRKSIRFSAKSGSIQNEEVSQCLKQN